MVGVEELEWPAENPDLNFPGYLLRWTDMHQGLVSQEHKGVMCRCPNPKSQPSKIVNLTQHCLKYKPTDGPL